MNDNKTPLVSVIMPTYNHANFIGRALQSLLDQTYANWELIVIDNHSTDNTDNVLAGFSDPRISYLKIHNNGVIALSRNMGIRKAKGEWIAFLDSDDWWSCEKLKVCCDSVRSNIDIIYHDLLIEEESKSFFSSRKTLKSRQLQSPVLLDLLIHGNLIANSSVVVRKRLLEKVGLIDENPEMVASEDYNTWLRIAEISEGFLHIDKMLGFYMVTQYGMSKRDMTVPWRCAVNNYLHLFSKNEKILFDCITAYESGKYSHVHYDYDNAVRNFNFCLKNAPVLMRAKAIIRVLISYIGLYRNILRTESSQEKR
jgi:glycosyltransferase involved in cell wall biosynthesis